MEPGLLKVQGKTRPSVAKALDNGNTQHFQRYDGKDATRYGAKRPASATYTSKEQPAKK